MSATKSVIPWTTNYLRQGVVLALAERSGATASSVRYGYRDLGDSLSVTLNRTTEKQDIYEGRSGQGRLVRSDTKSSADTVTVEFRDMTVQNYALFMGLDFETRSVAATPVTNEQMLRPFPGATYPIGATSTYREGIRSVTSIEALTISGGTWAAGAEHDVGDVVIVAGSPAQAHICTVGGTSADPTEPTWASAGGTASDNDITWRHLGPEALTVTTDYVVDLTSGAVVSIVPAGTFGATTLSRVPDGYYLTLLLDYTPVAEGYVRLIPLATAKTYSLRGYGQSEQGEVLDFVADFCTANGSGESQWISSAEPQTFTVQFAALAVGDDVPLQVSQKVFSQF